MTTGRARWGRAAGDGAGVPARPRPALLAAAALVGALVAALVGAPVAGPAAAAAAPGPGDAELTAYLARVAENGFSGAVLVARGDEVLARSASGVADDGTGRPVTPDTGFDVGSIAKQFTAATVLALRDDGLLALTDPLVRHLPGAPGDKGSITLEQLLTHTAGLAEDHVGSDLEPLDRDAAVRRILEAPLRSRPGSGWAYSNSGYTLLAAVVEAVTGRPFPEVVRERVLAPAGLEATGFVGEDRFRRAPVAHGYANGEHTGSPALWPLEWGLVGNGGMISTVDDLFRWQRELRGGRVLPAATAAELMAPRVDEGGGVAYGYGWASGPTPLGPRGGHNGGGIGGNAVLAVHPATDHVVVVLSNRITLRTVLDVPVAAHLPADELADALAGGLAGGGYELPRPTLAAWIAPAAVAVALSVLVAAVALVRRVRRRRGAGGARPGPGRRRRGDRRPAG